MTTSLPLVTFRDAHISADGKYRYWLERRWLHAPADAPLIVWCMLNPSTANANVDDPTIRRCIGFSHAWGYRRLVVVNLYAYRATEPRDLKGLGGPELFGPENAFWLHSYIEAADAHLIICAWGGKRFKRVPLPLPVGSITKARQWCLGRTKSGEPLHPLYLPADTQLVRT